MASVIEVITHAADRHGVDRALALATAYWESKYNPRAVGDGGTSYGLYQLHEGGQLGDNTPEWAFIPENNANQALSTMGRVARQHPDWSPGQIAVGSQRPGEEVRDKYIAFINEWVPRIRRGELPGGGVAPPSPPGGPPPPSPPGGGDGGGSSGNPVMTFLSKVFQPFVDPVGSIGQASGAATASVGKAVNFFSLPNLGMRVFAGFLGLLFITMGIVFYAGGSKS